MEFKKKVTMSKDKSFSIELTEADLACEETMNKFQSVMDEYQESFVKYIQSVANELEITDDCASSVVYLRSRSRWSQELEDELISLYRKGTPPNMCDFGCGG